MKKSSNKNPTFIPHNVPRPWGTLPCTTTLLPAGSKAVRHAQSQGRGSLENPDSYHILPCPGGGSIQLRVQRHALRAPHCRGHTPRSTLWDRKGKGKKGRQKKGGPGAPCTHIRCGEARRLAVPAPLADPHRRWTRVKPAQPTDSSISVDMEWTGKPLFSLLDDS